MKVVFASHTFFSPVFVVGSHHLARSIARAGHSVWHVSSAFSLLHLPFALARQDYRTRARLAASDGRLVEPNLWESVPLTLAPWPLLRRLATPEAGYLLAVRSLQKQAARLGFERPDLLLIDEPRMASLIATLAPRRVIYRPTDVYRDLKGDPTLVGVERRLLPRVDAVVGTSAVVIDHVRSLRADLPSMLLSNGVDTGHFATPRPEPAERGPLGDIARRSAAEHDWRGKDVERAQCGGRIQSDPRRADAKTCLQPGQALEENRARRHRRVRSGGARGESRVHLEKLDRGR
jgi:hypothetical protein